MSEKKGIKEGPPIWVESIMNPAEYKESHKKFPSTTLTSMAPPYEENYHSGGKWRAGMGGNLYPHEIRNINGNIDYLIKNVKTKE